MKKFLLIYLLIFSTIVHSYPVGVKGSGVTSSYPSLIDLNFLKLSKTGAKTSLTSLGAALADSLAIGGALDSNSILDLQSTTKAFLPPRMTDVQMKAIPSPTAGMTVFNTDYGIPASYNGTTWNYHFSKLQGDDDYSAIVDSAGGVSGENLEFITGNCSNANPSTCTLSGFTVAPICTVTSRTASVFCSNTTTSNSISFQCSTDSGAAYNSSSSKNISCQKSGADYAATAASAVLQSSANYSRRAYTPIFTGFGAVSNVGCYESREGEFNVIDCRFTVGATTATEARVSLPSGLMSSSSIYTGGIIIGVMARQTSVNNGIGVLIEPSSTYLTFTGGIGTNSMLAKQNGNGIATSGDTFSFQVRVPVSGWTASPFIVGSFEGIEKCASNGECDDTLSASASAAGVVSGLNVPSWIGNCVVTGTSVFTCPLSGFTVAPHCSVDVFKPGSSNGNAIIRTITATSLEYITVVGTTDGAAAYAAEIICQKTGTDYKPKTAKIASSIGVPTVPGIVGVSTGERIDTFSVSYAGTNAGNPASWTNCTASPCNIDQIGTTVTSITRAAAGTYDLNVSKTYAKLKCTATATTAGTGYQIVSQMACLNCSSLNFATGSSADTTGTIMCQGSY